ncbi:MAG TPA: hypothetical protein VHF25_11870 [Nitriliruptorales bacterium]|nr:hypothetical protein [Nitriliruptorales bacterium]
MSVGEVADLLVVCTGNIARSPFAASLLEHEARRRLGDDGPVRVHSAGVHGLEGQSAVEEMRREAAGRGLDLERHRGTATTSRVVEGADLIITMTETQRRRVTELAPVARTRTFTLKELARLTERCDEVPSDLPPRERLRRLAEAAHRARPQLPPPAGAEDIADPYGGTRDGYRRCAAEIEQLVRRVSPQLFGDGRERSRPEQPGE